MNNLKTGMKVAGFGFLLIIITTIAQLLISMATGSYETIDTWWGGIIQGVIVGLVAWLFSRQLHPTDRRQTWQHGAGFALTMTVYALVMVLPNTWDSIFGNWSIYLVIAGALVGPLFVKTTITSGSNHKITQNEP